MALSHHLFSAALPPYGIASVLYLWFVLGRSARLSRAAMVSLAIGLAVQTAATIVRGAELHRAPFTNLFESLSLLGWAVVAVYLVLEHRHRISALGAYVSVLALGLTAIASSMPNGTRTSLPPALQSNWSVIHVTSCILAYTGFVLAFGAALAQVVQSRLLKSKRISALQGHLPSLDVMDNLTYRLVALGWPMLTLGIITGALWAQAAWGSYWSWDPKETWSLITWLIFAAYLHVRIAQGWRGKWALRLVVLGFISVLITFVGVNLLAPGLHQHIW